MIEFLWFGLAIVIGTYLTSYLGYTLMQMSAAKLSFKLRARYLASLMR